MVDERTPRDAGPELGSEPTSVDVPPAEPAELRPEEVVRGAVRGTMILMTRTAGLQVMGFVAFIAIARLISPADFGLFVIALAVESFTMVFVTAGLPAGLIRQEARPSASEQQALGGFSLLVALLISGLVLLAGFVILPRFGVDSTAAKVIAIALLSLPLRAARMIPFALMARDLRFDRMAIIDVASRTALYGCALPAAAAGLGVYGLAAAIPVAGLVSSVLASRMQPWARGFRLDLEVAHGHLKFGLRVALFRFLVAAFQLVFVAVLALAASATLAGYYGLSVRVLGIPITAVQALQRVGFPALSRVAAGAERTRRMAQATAVSAVAVGLPLTVLVGSAQPLVSFLFGERWLPATDIIILSSPGLLLFASVGAVIASRALADGDTRSPIIAAAGQITVSLGLAAVLIPGLGATAAGISLGAGYLVYAGSLFLRFHAAERWRAAGSALRALLVAAVAAGAGQAVRVGDGPVELAVAVAVSGIAWVVMALLLTRPELLSLIRLLRQHLGRDRPRKTEADAELGSAGAV